MVCLLVACFEHKQFEIFLVFGVGVILDGVFRNDNGAFVVVAEIVAEVVVELCVLQLLKGEFVLKLEYGALGNVNFVAENNPKSLAALLWR